MVVVSNHADASSRVIQETKSETRTAVQDLCLTGVVLGLCDETFVLGTDLLGKLGPPANCGAMEVEDVDGYRHEHGQTPEQCRRPLEWMRLAQVRVHCRRCQPVMRGRGGG